MSKIGNFGKEIIFKVSDNKVLTFNGLNRNIKSKWVEHNSILSRPSSEFVGIELDTITMTVVLSASLGVKPKKIMSKIEDLCKSGTVEYLVIGNSKVGKGKYYIESVSEAWNEIFIKGELLQATLSISFKEYGE